MNTVSHITLLTQLALLQLNHGGETLTSLHNGVLDTDEHTTKGMNKEVYIAKTLGEYETRHQITEFCLANKDILDNPTGALRLKDLHNWIKAEVVLVQVKPLRSKKPWE